MLYLFLTILALVTILKLVILIKAIYEGSFKKKNKKSTRPRLHWFIFSSSAQNAKTTTKGKK